MCMVPPCLGRQGGKYFMNIIRKIASMSKKKSDTYGYELQVITTMVCSCKKPKPFKAEFVMVGVSSIDLNHPTMKRIVRTWCNICNCEISSKPVTGLKFNKKAAKSKLVKKING